MRRGIDPICAGMGRNRTATEKTRFDSKGKASQSEEQQREGIAQTCYGFAKQGKGKAMLERRCEGTALHGQAARREGKASTDKTGGATAKNCGEKFRKGIVCIAMA